MVEIERATRGKAFLGGYRHKLTKAEYHHAAVQTMRKKRPDRGIETFSRDTQVHAYIHTIKWSEGLLTQLINPLN